MQIQHKKILIKAKKVIKRTREIFIRKYCKQLLHTSNENIFKFRY